MAPLPANNTARMFVDYSTGRNEHHFTWRIPDSGDLGAAQDSALDFLESMEALLPIGFNVFAVRYQAKGSNISLPIAGSVLDGFEGTNTDGIAQVDEPREFVWVGRTPTTGRRWELSLYGLRLNTPDDYRFSGGERPPALQAATVVLRLASLAGNLGGIDGGPPTIYDYVNVNYNSHWESAARA